MRLDHHLSKEKVRVGCTVKLSRIRNPLLRIRNPKDNVQIFGVDAFRGNTRSHPEHDG